ncbi:MAG TPA: hypothetical protein VGE41_02510, partial [Verrucomicrobiae bacterium]
AGVEGLQKLGENAIFSATFPYLTVLTDAIFHPYIEIINIYGPPYGTYGTYAYSKHMHAMPDQLSAPKYVKCDRLIIDCWT